MTQLSHDASALLMCLSAPRRAQDLKTQVGWPEQRFNAALSQLVSSNQVEVYGSPGEDRICALQQIILDTRTAIMMPI
jgi:hypothetical protein